MKSLQIDTAKFSPRVHEGAGGKVVAYTAASIEPKADEASDRIVKDYTALTVWRPTSGPCEARAVPDEAQRTQLEARLTTLRNAMRSAANTNDGRLKIGAAVAAMFAGFVSQRNIDTQSTCATYVLELEHHPAWAVERVCLAVRRGKVPNINPAFPPTTVQLNQLCDLETASVKVEAAKIKGALDLVLAREPSPEQIASRKATALAWLNRGADPVTQPQAPVTCATLSEANKRTLERSGFDPVTGVTSYLLESLARKAAG